MVEERMVSEYGGFDVGRSEKDQKWDLGFIYQE